MAVSNMIEDRWIAENNEEISIRKPSIDEIEINNLIDPAIKENAIVSRKGETFQETQSTDRFPERISDNVRQDEVEEIASSMMTEIAPETLEVLEPSEEEILESPDEEVIEKVSEEVSEVPDDSSKKYDWEPETSKQDFMEWSKGESGEVSKRPLMKWFLDIDAGDGQLPENYRYPVGAIKEDGPHYCPIAMDHSWELASGKQTGIANRNIQKKIIFLKNREGFSLNDDQMDFTERHMSAEKDNYHTLENINEPGHLEFIEDSNLKFNSSLAGSKVIYEDDSVIDVPVVPMREGVFTGTDGIPTLKKYEYFSKDAHWLEGQPILKGHTRPTELVTYKHNRIGKLMNVMARPDKKDVVAVARYYKEKLTPEDMARIKSGTPYDGSIAYTTHTSFVDGNHNGTKYNAIEDSGYHFYHFAELANGVGACSTKDGCGFMLNEAPKKDSGPSVNVIKSYYNDLRRADIEYNGSGYSIKLNATNGGSGLLETSDKETAEKWSKIYTRKGLIPISMKLNYNCPKDQKSGEGPGSCGGSKGAKETSPRKQTESAMDKDFKKGFDKVIDKKFGKISNVPDDILKSYKKDVNKLNLINKDLIELKEALKNDVAKGRNSLAKRTRDNISELEQEQKKYTSKVNDVKKKYNIPDTKPHNSMPINNRAASSAKSLAKDYISQEIDISKVSDEDMTNQAYEEFSQIVDRSKDREFNKKAWNEYKDTWIKTFKDTMSSSKKPKQNSQFSQLQKLNGNNMTEEEFIAPEEVVETSDNAVQKLNEAFEAKLNERDAKIADLEIQLDDLVQKQNAAEEALVAERANADFEAFSLKLNAKARQDAQVHYDGFKAEGWSYFDKNDVLRQDIPKQNAKGVAAGVGDNGSELQAARDLFKKAQKERFGKRA